MFDNKVILITGGTGSFGKHFIRKILENYIIGGRRTIKKRVIKAVEDVAIEFNHQYIV